MLSVVQAFGQNSAIPPSLNVELNGENAFLHRLQKDLVSFLKENFPSVLMDPILAQPCCPSRFLLKALTSTGVPLEKLFFSGLFLLDIILGSVTVN